MANETQAAKPEFLPYEQNFPSLYNRLRSYYKQPWNYNVKPFKIIGNVYYIGDKIVGVHLIDTGAGLILLDTGYPCARELYINNIYELGFSPKDIKYIVHTHEHVDHFGTTAEFIAMSGAKTVISRPGYEVFQNRMEATLAQDAETDMYCYCDTNFPHDIIVDDGDTLELGNTKLTFWITPGHAEGVLTIYFDTVEDGKTYHVIQLGGATVVTMHSEHCKKYGIPLSVRQEAVESMDRLRAMNLPVDVVLGNHPNQNNTLGKLQKMLENPGTNPFIDPEEWDAFLVRTKALFLRFLDFDKG